jgi:hypothetical protein
LPVVVDPGKLRPITDSTLLAAKPEFAWPAVAKAKNYTLNLYFLGSQVWTAPTEQTRLEYSGETPLKPGATYSWEVTATRDSKTVTVCEGMFRMASDHQRAEAESLAKLLVTPDPIYLALAAMWYKQNGLVLDAIAVNEQLAKLSPDAAIYRELADLYFQVGREADANAAEAKATELEKKAERSGQ